MSIGEDKIINSIIDLDIYGNRKGKIEFFGGNLVRNNSDYIKSIFFSLDEYLNNILSSDDSEKPSTPIIYELGKKISFFLLCDIISSDTWKEKVIPMINSKEDWILGIISIINSLGIGKWKIRDIDSKEKLIIDIYNSYELSYYLEKKVNFDKYQPEFSFSIGLATSIMSIIYDTNVLENGIDESYIDLYNKCYDNKNPFVGREVRISSNNYDYCEIIVERKN